MKLPCEKLWRLISVCAGMAEFMFDLGRLFDIPSEDQVKFYSSYCMVLLVLQTVNSAERCAPGAYMPLVLLILLASFHLPDEQSFL